MTLRLRITHTSHFTYDRPVTASFNEVRLTPSRTPWQIPLEAVLQVDEATWQYQYIDFWGTHVQVFEAQNPHRELLVESTSLVEVDGSGWPAPRLDTTWADLSTDWVLDRFAEYLVPTEASAANPDLITIADECAADRGPHEAALALSTRINDEMTYLPGSTGVQTVAREAWLARSGVCQDYAHLLIGALRHLGIPARYVSGYLHPSKQPVVGEAAVGESHAWVEWWLGDWAGHDPTNDAPVGERHVIVGRGRDYNDVPPIMGIIGGSASSDLDVRVEITRVV